MKRGVTGRYHVTITARERIKAFVPKPLPPEPPLVIDGTLQQALELALLALGRLDSISMLLPDPDLFIYSYVRKEAVLSSQIEGTQSSLSDLLLFELEQAPGVPQDDLDLVEVSNYVAALDHGIARLRGDFPLSNRLIREIHGVLLARGRGSDKDPGEFRRSQNWIGGTRPGNAVFVPPPHTAVPDCMAAFERFLHADDDGLPLLVRAGLAHVQFETIHPFLDGNGRVGRLLITFLLHHGGILREPLLYLSLYFKQHRAMYYDLLDRVQARRRLGSVAGVLPGRRLSQVVHGRGHHSGAAGSECFATDRAAMIEGTGRRASSALRVHEAFKAAAYPNLASAAECNRPLVLRRLLGDEPPVDLKHRPRTDREAPQPAICLRPIPGRTA